MGVRIFLTKNSGNKEVSDIAIFSPFIKQTNIILWFRCLQEQMYQCNLILYFVFQNIDAQLFFY